ncbi:MAG TPA: branched-chain amino acid ABC transporter permease [Actinomycetota bacterium]|nr:branched-chain amino acid ABC transporter permease [Actinomycetota bacterium]
MRRRVKAAFSAAWWTGLGRLGLSPERWNALPRTARRLTKALVWTAIALLLVAYLGVWQWSALAIAAVVLVLVVPRYGNLTFRGRPIGRFVLPVGVLLLAVTYPFYANSNGVVSTGMPQLPIFGTFPLMSTMVNMGIFAIMALGLNFVVGYAGLLDLGYVAFYAMGSYMAGWLASSQFSQVNIRFGGIGVIKGLTGIHISMWLVLPAAGIATAIVGVIIGLPTLRLRGDYLAIVTLGFGEIFPQIARNGDSLGGFNLTNGTGGITPIDPPGFGNWIHHNLGLPANYGALGTTFDRDYFWTVLVLLLITVFCSARLRESRLGRAWIAIREDEIAAAAMGIPLMRTKTWAYATGAFFGGVAGAYYASYNSSTNPDEFMFQISVFILVMVILGGMGSIWGVIFGAAFLTYLNSEGLNNIGAWLNGHFGPGGSDVTIWHKALNVPNYNYGIYGVVLVLVMLFRPEGLIPSRRRAAELHEGVHDEPLYDVAHDEPLYDGAK